MFNLGATFVDTILEGFKGILSGMSLDILLFVFAGLMAAIIIASAIRLAFCYESKALRQMKRINKYLKNNPTITDENLVEFHKKMKKLPRRIRDRWQLFMLEREGSPSRYLTVEYCVKRPLDNSAINSNKKIVGLSTIVICLLSFVLSMCYLISYAGEAYINLIYVMQALVIPFICGLVGTLYCLILVLRYTSVNSYLYDAFTEFVRHIDKVTNAMPDYVDYELLFTKKEIDEGIPVLREYLEKRALEEQRLLEKAKQDEANHSPYDFSDLGINGEQLIERAVKESEKFLMFKLQTQQEITELEKQLQKTEQNMEDMERDANRKLQAIKENLERLDKAMAETTNNVEVNYNRRQVNNEMTKKATLEKDLENMLAKEKVAADALRIEIQKRKELIEGNKDEVQVALKSEYDTFATKVYQELNEKITRDNSEQMREMEMVIARLKAKVKEFSKDLEKKDNLVEARNIELDNLRQQVIQLKQAANSKKQNKHKKSAEVLTLNEQIEAINSQSQDVTNPVVQNEEIYMQPQEQQPQTLYAEQTYDNQIYPDTNAYDQNFIPDYNQLNYEQPVYQEEVPYQETPNFDAPLNYDQQVWQDVQPEQEKISPVEEKAEELALEEKKEEKPKRKSTVKKSSSVKPASAKNIKNSKKKEKEEVKEEKVQKVEEKAEVEEPKAEETKQPEKKEEKAIEKSEIQELKEEIKKVTQKLEEKEQEKTEKEKEEAKKFVDNEDLEALQKQIAEENERLKQQQEELRAQIDKTLKTMEKSSNASKAERTRNIKKIKDLISKLKQEAADAKARGASKAEINKINKSAAELVKVIADYQANNSNK